MTLQRSLLSLCLLAGCASPAAKSDSPTAPTPREASRDLSLEVHSADTSGAGWQLVAPGATLKSGSQFSLRIEVPHSSYVFIGQRTASGQIEVIYPPATSPGLRGEPGQPLLLPAAGQWFTVDDRTGDEALFVLCKPTSDHETVQALLKERGEAACVKTRDPPPPDVKLRDRGKTARGTIDQDGLGILCFPFFHR